MSKRKGFKFYRKFIGFGSRSSVENITRIFNIFLLGFSDLLPAVQSNEFPRLVRVQSSNNLLQQPQKIVEILRKYQAKNFCFSPCNNSTFISCRGRLKDNAPCPLPLQQRRRPRAQKICSVFRFAKCTTCDAKSENSI